MLLVAMIGLILVVENLRGCLNAAHNLITDLQEKLEEKDVPYEELKAEFYRRLQEMKERAVTLGEEIWELEDLIAGLNDVQKYRAKHKIGGAR